MESDGDQKKDDSAQALETVAEKAPLNTPEKTPEDMLETGPRSEPETAPVAGSRWLPRLMQALRALGAYLLRPIHFLRAGLAKSGIAGRGLLQRFKMRSAEPGEKEAATDERAAAREQTHAKAKMREDHGKEAPPQEAPPPRPSSKVHSILLYLLVLIIGGIAGMTFSFVLFSTMVSNQAKKIYDQRDDITQLENQQSRLLESEANFRKENETYRQRLRELEALEAARNAEKETAVQEPAGNPAAAVRGKQAVAKKTGKCNLDAGNIDDNLTRCIDEFNRK